MPSIWIPVISTRSIPNVTESLYSHFLSRHTEHLLVPVVDILGQNAILSPGDVRSSPGLDPDAGDVDETARGSWLEAAHLVHRGELGVVQALVGVSALDNHVALVELESDETVDGLLRGGDGSRDKLSLGGEVETVVEDLREVGRDELVSHGSDVSVERHTLEVHVGGSEDGGGGRLVTSSGLDTNESVLDNVDTSDTVPSGEGVEREEDLDSVGHNLAIGWEEDLHGETLGPLDVNGLRLLWGLLWGHGELPHVIGRRLVGVLEDTSLVRDVEQVLVGRPWLGGGLGDWDTVGSSVLQKGGSTGESVVKLGQSPRSDDLDGRRKTVEGELESDLVVSFTGASVRDEAGNQMSDILGMTWYDSLAALSLGDLNHASGDDGSGKGGTEKVDVLVDGIALHGS